MSDAWEQAHELILAIAAPLRRQQHSLLQMPRHMRVRSRVGIVRHHHDRFVEVLVQALQDLKHFRCGVAVQIALSARLRAAMSDRLRWRAQSQRVAPVRRRAAWQAADAGRQAPD